MRQVRVGAEIVGAAVDGIAETELGSTGAGAEEGVGNLSVEVVDNSDRGCERAGLDVVGDRLRAVGKADYVGAADVFSEMSGKGRG